MIGSPPLPGHADAPAASGSPGTSVATDQARVRSDDSAPTWLAVCIDGSGVAAPRPDWLVRLSLNVRAAVRTVSCDVPAHLIARWRADSGRSQLLVVLHGPFGPEEAPLTTADRLLVPVRADLAALAGPGAASAAVLTSLLRRRVDMELNASSSATVNRRAG